MKQQLTDVMNSSDLNLPIRWALITCSLISTVISAEEPTLRYHFKPHDHVLGDVHPYFRDGECFLYYLKPQTYASTLVRSTDWLHWQELPLTHEAVQPDDWVSPYFVLGVFHDPKADVFRTFYGHAKGRMASSVSHDLLHWSCAPKEFCVPSADYYERRRDPFVFWIPESNEYGCVMTTWMKGRPKETAGAISLATSPDLKRWKDHGPIIDPGDIGEPECPQMFHLGQHWYLLASIYERAVGQPVYWTSNQPQGPWKQQPEGKLDGKDLCAAQIALDGDTPLLFGWIPLTPSKPGKQNWGGQLALPREVYALPDGRLGTRLPAELAKTFDSLPWLAVDDFHITTNPHVVEGQWKRIAAKFTLTMPVSTLEVRLHLGTLGDVAIRREALRALDAKGECWSELPVELPSHQPFNVQLFIEGNIVELFVHDRYSLAARMPASDAAMELSFATKASTARVAAMKVCEWAPQD